MTLNVAGATWNTCRRLRNDTRLRQSSLTTWRWTLPVRLRKQQLEKVNELDKVCSWAESHGRDPEESPNPKLVRAFCTITGIKKRLIAKMKWKPYA